MKWARKLYIFILKSIGIPMSTIHSKCIAYLEKNLVEIDDDEHFIAITMLDAGLDCDSVYNTLRVARRKRAFRRKLLELGIKGANLDQLVDNYMSDLRGNTKVDDLVKKAQQDYMDWQEKLKSKKKNTI